ncbi:putative NBD/HSP70 family sugar kinase [Lachnospiraceae bacterium PF1-21]|uniref:ROK family protein n=1 Tax=Ohessyouella blattaphilus TaxID=2949333 RepID=A0ABT1EJH4_9FIRM|nr:ROK family transcriptional regulator [Ohessyouella blattaphilus]MCP1110861.1 ROK family protein [Ohessyouella blattaphilus]MCR8564255.1 ROK family protein [Ohessyouella blattaphilus]
MREKIEPTGRRLVADRSLSRVINEKAIAEEIHRRSGVSRATLAKDLGISKPAIASNVELLIASGLVVERGEGEAAKKGGRKPILLYFNESLRYVGALDLSFRNPVCAVADMNNCLIGLKRVKAKKKATAEDKRQQIRDTFFEILDENQIPREKLELIVISHPGVFTDDEPDFISERHVDFANIGIREYLKQELKIHVSVRNDAGMAALGEWYVSAEKGDENLLYISAGVGVGAGIILNGKLHLGEGNAAGEVGYVILDDGRSVEETIAMESLFKELSERGLSISGENPLNFQEVVALARQGDERVCEVVHEFGYKLGKMIYNCCTFLDVKKVLLGGDYLSFGEVILEGVREFIDSTKGFVKPQVAIGELREGAGIYGCFVVGTEKIIEKIIQQGGKK